jgi:hypothetical protein
MTDTQSGDALAEAFATAFPLRKAEIWRDAHLASSETNVAGQVIAQWEQIGLLRGRLQAAKAPVVTSQASQETALAEAVFLTRYGFGTPSLHIVRPGDRLRVYNDAETTNEVYAVIGVSPQEALSLDTNIQLTRKGIGDYGLPEGNG